MNPDSNFQIGHPLNQEHHVIYRTKIRTGGQRSWKEQFFPLYVFLMLLFS